MTSFDQREFRNLMGNFCSGIVVVTAMDGETPIGFTAQSFVSLSIDPPLVAICPSNTSRTWERIRAVGKFCINILSDQQESISNCFAKSEADKYADVSWSCEDGEAPVLDNSLALIQCTLEAEHDAGDHTIAIGRVQSFSQTSGETAPLLYFRGRYNELANT